MYQFIFEQKKTWLRIVWSSEPLGGGMESKPIFSRARRTSLVERAGGPLPQDRRVTRHSSLPCPPARPYAALTGSGRSLRASPRRRRATVSKRTAIALQESEKKREGKKSSVGGVEPRQHGHQEKEQQESPSDEPRVHHPEPCRHCFMCCHGVPPRADVRGKSRLTCWRFFCLCS